MTRTTKVQTPQYHVAVMISATERDAQFMDSFDAHAHAKRKAKIPGNHFLVFSVVDIASNAVLCRYMYDAENKKLLINDEIPSIANA